jgi:ATP-dependent RNA helicase RhlB
VLELAYEHMNEPEKLVVETESVTAARVRQKLYYPADEEKIPLLIGLLSRSEGARTMVFVNTKAFVERVARALEKAGYRVGVLSGDVPQKKRESLLKKFQAGQLEILVATDVAARGLHIDGVSHVYNFDLPFDAEDYVHRIGRTARLGAEGDAISFACERYGMSLPDIEAFIDQKIPGEHVTPEMLVALPRTPRPQPAAGEEGEADDSIGAIFKEAREQRAADEQRRGGGGRRGAGAGGGDGRSRGRGAGPRERTGDGHRERAARPPRKPDAARAPAPAGEAAQSAAGAAQQAFVTAPGVEGERAPRKRRRRRGGKRIEGGESAVQHVVGGDASSVRAPKAPVHKPATKSATKSSTKPAGTDASASLLARIGRGLKSLVTRAPRSQH